MATKIRKEQIRIEEFIQSHSDVDWTDDDLTASAAAISGTMAPKESPTFTGQPKSPTPSQNESDATRIATVGFVRTAVASGGGGGGAAALYVDDDDLGNIELYAINTSSTLVVTDDDLGNIGLSLT